MTLLLAFAAMKLLIVATNVGGCVEAVEVVAGPWDALAIGSIKNLGRLFCRVGVADLYKKIMAIADFK